MSKVPADPSPVLARPKWAPAGYLLAVALLGPFFSPMVSVLSGSMSAGATLRYGVIGLYFGVQFYLMLALLLVAATAAASGHRKGLLLTTVVAGLACLLLIVALPAFALDYLQMRRSMPAQAFAPFGLAGKKTAVAAALGVPVFFLIFLGSLRAARAVGALQTRRAREETPGSLMIGTR